MAMMNNGAGTKPSARMSSCPASYTGLDRSDWEETADHLLVSLRPYFSPDHSRIDLPGPKVGTGQDSDGLEGYARSLLLAGFRLKGLEGQDPLGLADWYAEGLINGTDPKNPNRWPRLNQVAQAKVEAASIALILDMTRKQIWDQLSRPQQNRVINWLKDFVGDDSSPRNNWLWFRVLVETFLYSVDGPCNENDIAIDLARHDSYYRSHGWYADGLNRNFDHYSGWAMQLYPTLFARMQGASDLAQDRFLRDRERLGKYVSDAINLVGADGAPLFQGRSLTYRFAAAAPFWAAVLADVDTVPLGQIRRATSGILKHFLDHGAINENGLLTLGWFHEFPQMRQSYSGYCSPYWAVKGMLGLALPSSHPVWNTAELPLPVETNEVNLALSAPGWLVNATPTDGIVRIINHGTDHQQPGSNAGDGLLYARLGYSTATTPLLDDESDRNPLDQAVVLLDETGNASHRSGFERIHSCTNHLTDSQAVSVGVSSSHDHWVKPDQLQKAIGAGLIGAAQPAAQTTMISLVRGGWEVRIFQLKELSPAAREVRIGGWALAGDPADFSTEIETETPSVKVSVKRELPGGQHLVSHLVALTNNFEAATLEIDDRVGASPVAEISKTPILRLRPAEKDWFAVGVYLGGSDRDKVPSQCYIDSSQNSLWVNVTWNDGLNTRTEVPMQRDDYGILRSPQTICPTRAACNKEKQ